MLDAYELQLVLFVFCGSHGGSEDGEYNIASSHRRIFLALKMNMRHHKRKAAALPSGIICSDWLESIRSGKVYHINHFKQIDEINCGAVVKRTICQGYRFPRAPLDAAKQTFLYQISATGWYFGALNFLTRFFRAEHRPSKKRKV